MSTVVRVRRHLASDTIHVPEARALVGKDVESVVSEVEDPEGSSNRYPLRDSVLR